MKQHPLKSVFILAVTVLTLICSFKYPGSVSIYILFSVVFNTLLLMGFRKNRIFFDTFIGIFLWLGFWAKFTARAILYNSTFHDPVGYFNHSPQAYDKALFISTVASLALILASLAREYFFFKYNESPSEQPSSHENNLHNNKSHFVFFLFLFFAISISTSNIILGIYQKGCPPKTILPFGLNGAYSWLLLFGLTSFAAVLLNKEIREKKLPYFMVILAFAENFFSNVSMLSRGMILNSSALILGIYFTYLKMKFPLPLKFKFFIISSFVFLFACSVFTVNIIRIYRFNIGEDYRSIQQVVTTSQQQLTSVLFIDRWVGIEGLMAISSYPHQSFKLLKLALAENFANTGTSFYDKEIAKQQFSPKALITNHFITLPGVIGFLYYPGSFLFLIFGMIFIGLLGACFDFLVYYLGNQNLILSALLAQVTAYRFAHFGYVPKQSYLLFGAILINIFIIAIVNSPSLRRYCSKFFPEKPNKGLS